MQQTQLYNNCTGEQEEEEEFVGPEYDDEPLQTVHLYVYAEAPEQPVFWHQDRIIALLIGMLAFSFLVGLCLLPSEPSFIIQTLIVPAHFQTTTQQVSVPLVPTGRQEIPATPARGILTVYNGGLFVQQLPANFLVTTASGLAFATEDAVTIPAANPPSWGMAIVAVQAVIAGAQGNIPAEAIRQNYGSDILIKNLAPLAGGHDASLTTYATHEDQQHALETARQLLITRQPVQLLARPCTETIQQAETSVTVSWHCQSATYQVPSGVEILSVRLSGDHVLLTVKIVTRPVLTHFVK